MKEKGRIPEEELGIVLRKKRKKKRRKIGKDEEYDKRKNEKK